MRARAANALQRWLTWVLLLSALSAAAEDLAPTRREDLIGAWRLVRIEVTGPRTSGTDPFFGAGSEGLLIYDAAGWFSVQIMGAERPALTVPARRPELADEARRRQKAAVLDSYYAYYGTWEFDPGTSTVTHHAEGALYPAERDAIYPQQVAVHGSTMIFTRTQVTNGVRSTQSKVWARTTAP